MPVQECHLRADLALFAEISSYCPLLVKCPPILGCTLCLGPHFFLHLISCFNKPLAEWILWCYYYVQFLKSTYDCKEVATDSKVKIDVCLMPLFARNHVYHVIK